MVKFFSLMLVGIVIGTIGWSMFLDAVDRHMIEYQECGYQYCEPKEG